MVRNPASLEGPRSRPPVRAMALPRWILPLGIIWCAPAALLAVARFGLGYDSLGTPASWMLGFLGIQIFATIGVFDNVAAARGLLIGAGLLYATYFSGLVPGFAAVGSVLPQLCISVMMAIAVWLPFASGQLSLAQAGFMAVGAYAAAWLTVNHHWPFVPALVAGALAAAAIGLAVSYPALRLRGVYLAVATLGLGEVIRIFFLNFEPTGAAFGFAGIPKYTELWHMAVTLVAIGFCLLRLMRSRIGRAVVATRHDEIAAAALGIEITRIRVLTFTLGALLAGLAGGFQAHYIRFIAPDNYGLSALVEWLAMVMLGGFETFVGALAGAVVLGTLPELLHFMSEWRLMGYGVILVVLLIFRPEGIITGELLGLRRAPRIRIQAATSPSRSAARVVEHAHDLLVLKNVTKRFGAITAVNGVSLTVRSGEIHGIIGPNGAGKTTLFNVITGLSAADRGEILCHGKTIHNLRPQDVIRSGIARTFQNIRLFSSLSALENVMIGGHIRSRSGPVRCALGLDRGEERAETQRALQLLDVLGLADQAERPARTLSYGDQRRVEIARALASNPDLLLLDEPAAGMNATETAALASFIRRIRDEFGKAIIIIEHDMDLVMGLCERIAVLDFGTLIAEGTPSEIQRNEAVIAAYLGNPAREPADQIVSLPARASPEKRLG